MSDPKERDFEQDGKEGGDPLVTRCTSSAVIIARILLELNECPEAMGCIALLGAKIAASRLAVDGRFSAEYAVEEVHRGADEAKGAVVQFSRDTKGMH